MIIFPQNAFMFVLFYDFYRKAYRKKSPQEIEEQSIATATEKKFMDGNNNMDNKLNSSGIKSNEDAKKFSLSFDKTLSE